MADAREVSVFRLKPEEMPVFGLNDLFNSQQAQQYSLDKGHRALWVAAMHNHQLRTLFEELVVRCQWWAGYYDFVVAACQAIACQYLHSSNLLQPLLAHLTAVAQLLKPFIDTVQLPEPVLCEMYGIAPDEEMWECIIADCRDTWEVSNAAARQNGYLLFYTDLQQSYVRRMRRLSSTQHVAGLLQALVGQYKLTHLLPDDIIYNALQSLLAEAHTHGHLGFWTFIDAENAGPAAGSVPPAAPLSSAPPARAAEASAAGMSIRLPTNKLIANDTLLSGLAGSLALVPCEGATGESLDSQVVGGLNVAQVDKLQNLDAHAQLTQSQGDLVVWSTAQGRSSEGLGPGAALIGQLWEDANPELASLSSLESLQRMSDDVVLRNSDGITGLDGHNSLQVVEGELGITNPPIATTRQPGSLTRVGVSLSLNDLTGFNRLAQELGDLQLYLLPKTTDVNELAKVQAMGRNLIVSSNADLASLAGPGMSIRLPTNKLIANDKLESSLAGSLALVTRKGATGESLDNAIVTSEVVGGLDVAEMDKVQHLDALAQLTQSQRDLVVWSNAQLRSIEGLGPVTKLFGTMREDATPERISRRGLESLQRMSDDVVLRNSDGITGLDGLNSLQVVEGELGITNLPIATTRQPGSLTRVGVSLSLNDLTGFSRLAQASGHLQHYLLPKSPNVNELVKLQAVELNLITGANANFMPLTGPGVWRGKKAGNTGKPRKLQSSDVALRGPAAKDTSVDDLARVIKNKKNRKNKHTSWRRLSCLGIGIAVAATGAAVARMLLKRHGAIERL